jgi:hypothetical protein
MTVASDITSHGSTPLFKYMRREHAQRLLSEGVLRIGTLHEYRNIERHGVHIGDAREGSKGAILTVPRLEVRSQGDLPEFVRHQVKVGPGTVTFVNSTFLVTEDSPDFYIYSATTLPDFDAMREMGYDACIQIHNPTGFFRALNHTFRHKGDYQGLFNCVYMKRDLPPDEQHTIHPALIKDPSYERQREQRAIWRPLNTQPRPFIVACRKAARYCSNVA